jgi:hypothetical protein
VDLEAIRRQPGVVVIERRLAIDLRNEETRGDIRDRLGQFQPIAAEQAGPVTDQIDHAEEPAPHPKRQRDDRPPPVPASGVSEHRPAAGIIGRRLREIGDHDVLGHSFTVRTTTNVRHAYQAQL